MNCSWAVTEGCVAYVIKTAHRPTLPSNAGLMEPITVHTRKGSLVAAVFPAPVANGNIQTAQRIVDALLGAFHLPAPEHVPAASSGSCRPTIGGFDETIRPIPRRNLRRGQGAMPDQDGALPCTHT